MCPRSSAVSCRPTVLVTRGLSLALLSIASLFLASAEAQQQQQGQQPFTIKVDTQLVVETVIVKDKDGKPIEGLSEKDFVITEDNVPQTISVFQFQRLEDTPTATPTAVPAVPATLPQPAAAPAPNAAPLPAGSVKYQDRRLLVLFFDMVNTFPPDQLRAFTGADKFIRAQMKTPDLIALMTFQKGVVSVLQDFTDDRDALLGTLAKLMYPDEDDNNDPVGAFGQDGSEFNIFNNDRQLSALQTAVTMLRSVTGPKVAGVFLQRTPAEWPRQSGATPRHDQCGRSLERVLLPRGCPRARRDGAVGRCESGVAGRHWNVLRRDCNGHGV